MHAFTCRQQGITLPIAMQAVTEEKKDGDQVLSSLRNMPRDVFTGQGYTSDAAQHSSLWLAQSPEPILSGGSSDDARTPPFGVFNSPPYDQSGSTCEGATQVWPLDGLDLSAVMNLDGEEQSHFLFTVSEETSKLSRGWLGNVPPPNVLFNNREIDEDKPPLPTLHITDNITTTPSGMPLASTKTEETPTPFLTDQILPPETFRIDLSEDQPLHASSAQQLQWRTTHYESNPCLESLTIQSHPTDQNFKYCPLTKDDNDCEVDSAHYQMYGNELLDVGTATSDDSTETAGSKVTGSDAAAICMCDY